VTGLSQGDEAGGGGGESATAEVERPQVLLEVDVQPLAARPACFPDRGGHQPGFFPAGQLAHRDAQDAQYVRSFISFQWVRVSRYALVTIMGTPRSLSKRKLLTSRELLRKTRPSAFAQLVVQFSRRGAGKPGPAGAGNRNFRYNY